MRRGLQELAVAITGVVLGIVLFIEASNHVFSFGPNLLLNPSASLSYPLPWLFQGGDIYRPPTQLFLGLSVDGGVSWSAFYEDLAFWLAIPVLAIELSFHFGVPYLERVLSLQGQRRDK